MWGTRPAVALALALGMVAGCGKDEPRRPTPTEVFRENKADFDAVRQRLRQVAAMLPKERAGRASCAVPVPLDPPFAYRTGYHAESNAEVLMERALVDPDTETDRDEAFDFAPTYLLTALRRTGPRGPVDYPAAHLPTAESELTRLRFEMDRARAIRYVVVLRQVEYVAPHVDRKEANGGVWETFVGRVVLDAFLVDLQQIRLLCRFGVEDEINPMSVVYRADQGPFSGMYEDLRDGAGAEIAENLTTLTRGAADPPG